jgi:RHS repeat-associated protein
MTAMTDAGTPARTVSMAYDAASRVTAITNPRGYATTFDHDAMGRVTEETDPLSASETHDYNLAGDLTRTVDRNGTDLRYVYDTAGRLTAITDPAAVPYVSYGLDANGRATSITNDQGAIGYSYDAAGQVTQVASPQGTIGYQYNQAGQRSAMILPPAAPSGPTRTVNYDYDNDTGQPASVTDWNSRSTTYTYTDGGALSRIDRANGVYSLYDYDGAGRLTAISHYDPSDDPLAEYGYTLDANGNRTQVDITGSGVANHTETSTFDALDRLTNASYGPGASTFYTYDQNGNRATMTTGSLTATYTYDDADELTAITGAQAHTYSYDANGNRTGVDADTFAYDWANQLTSATVGTATVAYTYDGGGIRTSADDGSTTTPYLWDRASGLPLLVDDGTTSAVYGGGEIADVDNSSGDTTYALADALGSTRARVDDTGAVVGTSDWDVFGNERASTGADGPFGWTGQQQDAGTGLTYLRSRYYAPGSGRFLTRDTVAQSTAGTQGYNRYAYAANNPVTLTDPSGHIASALARLGQAISNVFWYIALIFDCILWGACRYHRTPSIPSSGPGGGGGGGGGGNGPTGPQHPRLPSPRCPNLYGEPVCTLPGTGGNDDFDPPGRWPDQPIIGPLMGCPWSIWADPNDCDKEKFDLILETSFFVSLDEFMERFRQKYRPDKLHWPSNPDCTKVQDLMEDVMFDLTEACVRHDFSYNNVKAIVGGVSSPAWEAKGGWREAVDYQLLHDSRTICHSRAMGFEETCDAQAFGFFKAVRIFGAGR